MVKRFIVLAVCALLTMAACGCVETQSGRTFGVSGLMATDIEAPDNESVVRLYLGQELATVGLQYHFIGAGDDQFVGAFVRMDLEPIGGLVRPYFGYQAAVATESSGAEAGGYHGPILGAEREVAPGISIGTEGWYRALSGELKDLDYVDEWRALLVLRGEVFTF